jgi:nucleoside-diphosphate-sugar epimerase
MRVFVAGATGAIGRPLISALTSAGHDVVGMTSSQSGLNTLHEIGADGIVADAFDANAVDRALIKVRPVAVIDELTSLPKHGRIGWRSVGTDTPEKEEMRAAAERDRRVRIEGGRNVYNAATSAGVKRYLVQSTGFFYAPGQGLAIETDPLALGATPGIAAGAETYMQIEQRVLGLDGPDGVALRYGFFYGPGTWFTPNGDAGNELRQGQCPLVGSGRGVWSWVHVEDAAAATVAALESAPGIYNIVDSDPLEISIWLPAFAKAIGAPEPPRVTEAEALRRFGPDFVYYETQLRGASNAKAKQELGFAPRRLEWSAMAHAHAAGRSTEAGPRVGNI